LAGSYKLLVRDGPRVRRERFDDLDSALAALEARARELEESLDPQPVKSILGRDYQPIQQVRARLELRGPRLRAGVDVRGDGSSEAFTGRVKRAIVEQRRGESPYDALRRAIGPNSPNVPHHPL
jgi:hypothetical protein